MIISQGILKTCAFSLTFDIFGNSTPHFDELIAKVEIAYTENKEIFKDESDENLDDPFSTARITQN